MAPTSDNWDWFIIEDFNEIRREKNRDRFGEFDHVGASKFSVTVHDLTEMEPVGGANTWCSGHG